MAGRVAIVTGGTRGIGRAISVGLKDAGYQVVANYAGDTTRANAFSKETGIPSRQWDVADLDACLAGVRGVVNEFGSVDIVVNNAGITRDATMRRMQRDRKSTRLNSSH